VNTETTRQQEAERTTPTCYICSHNGADSRDHVVPYSFFKNPRPANILTLPAHYSCHNSFDEEYARVVLSGLGSEGSARAKELWNTKTKRSIERSAPLRESVRASLVSKVDLISPSGLVFDHTPGIRIEVDRFYPLMRKIIQGLYLHHIGEFLSPEFRSVWNPNALLELSSDRRRLLEASQFGEVYSDIFGCRYLVENQRTNETSSVWWLCFYTDVVLRCYVPPRHLWSSSRNAKC
jgi:hypothetical protein